ncbi:hypothetical protein CU102_08765 [Phyllobacterium brassicacearum]|uniref:Uncharacterized protein n=1 Tax=Phyllobacterium brassicacearum TaxID=314235 RepID=A0A2P7BSL9_9HYPH|nr:hypothetical protein [Phyllobacterium brassicacearum]PSH69457.1 hypothetical protein CU102_08765 [Phyllobacterium brassicacearum]TDQ34357.1 hypothetical protein DEV91_10388 [Phyllobacterium brassicacearum]
MALLRNISTISTIALTAAVILTASIDQSTADETPTRTELCGKLQVQTQHAITEHAEAKRAAKAKALQKQATRYCAGNKQAQGIRAYAQALKLLGVQPITD